MSKQVKFCIMKLKIEGVINDEPTGTITIIKRDSEKGNVAQGDATLENAKYEVYANEDIIKDIRKLIEQKDDAFVQINSGCVVGIRHIKFMSKGDIGVKTDKILQIARRKKAEVEKIVLDYWGDKL